MNETHRISKLFDDLYDGNPWLGITLVGTLTGISARTAAAKTHPNQNSIWEITNHLIAWRLNVLDRVKGKIIQTPSHNYILPVKDTSEAAWAETLRSLEDSQQQWIGFLKSFNEQQFGDVYPVNGHTHYEHIHGIIQHDAYHLGQIVLLAKHTV